MVNWESQSKTTVTSQSLEDGHIYCIFYLFVFHSFTCLKTCHFTACAMSLWTSISIFYVNTARDVVTALLIFAKYLSLYLPNFSCTYWGTHTQARMYNQHTRGMATTRHRSLVERDGRKSLLETLHTKQKNVGKKQIFTNLKENIRAISYKVIKATSIKYTCICTYINTYVYSYTYLYLYIYIYVCIYCGSVLFTPNKFPRRNCRELSKLPWLSNRKIKRLTKPVGAVSDISPEVSSTDQPASNTKAFSDSRLSLEWQFKHESDKVPEKAGWNHIDPTSHAIDFCGSVLFPLS